MNNPRRPRGAQRIAAVVSAAVLAVGLAACGSAAPSPSSDPAENLGPQVLKVAHNTPPTSLDPALSATFGPTFLNLVYESLLKRDKDGVVGPGLAIEWTLSDDAQQLDLTLREGVTFQDGEVFDATAVKTNLDAGPTRGGDIPNQLSVIDDVKVVDDTHLTITMNRPASDLLGILASEAGMMISPKALKGKDLATKPVGTGPFTVDVFNQTGISYNKWPDYWDAERIKLDRIEYTTGLNDQARLNALISGQADLGTSMRTTQVEEAQKANPDLDYIAAPGTFVYGIMLNTAQSELSNPAMRLAILHAIDRKSIDSALFGGGCEPVVQPFPTSYWASDPSLEPSNAGYDPALAKKLLADAGLTGTPLKLYVGNTTVFQNMGTAVAEQLKAVGLDVSLEVLDPVALTKLRADGEFEASIASVQTGRPDPAQFVRQFYIADGIFNAGGMTYSGIEVPLFQMNTTDVQDERAEYMHEINKQVLDQGPTLIPICSSEVVNIFKKDVANVILPIAYDFDLSTIYFDPPR
ncbi:ABC transporter substrate-binding protein [soil metagenome]